MQWVIPGWVIGDECTSGWERAPVTTGIYLFNIRPNKSDIKIIVDRSGLCNTFGDKVERVDSASVSHFLSRLNTRSKMSCTRAEYSVKIHIGMSLEVGYDCRQLAIMATGSPDADALFQSQRVDRCRKTSMI